MQSDSKYANGDVSSIQIRFTFLEPILNFFYKKDAEKFSLLSMVVIFALRIVGFLKNFKLTPMPFDFSG